LFAEVWGRQDFGVLAPGEEPGGQFLKTRQLEFGEEAAVRLFGQALGGVVRSFGDAAADGGAEADADGFDCAVALEDAEGAGEEGERVEFGGGGELEAQDFDFGEAIDFEGADLAVAGGMGQQIQGVVVPDEGVGMNVVVRDGFGGSQRLVGDHREAAVLDGSLQVVDELAFGRIFGQAVRLAVKGGGQFFEVAERGVAQRAADFRERRLGPAEKVGAGQRLEELPAEIESRRFFEREGELRQAAAGQPPVLAAVVAGFIDELKAEAAEQEQIAVDGFLVDGVLGGQFAKRRPLPPRGERAEEHPVSKDRRLIGHGSDGRKPNDATLAAIRDKPCPSTARVPIAPQTGD